MTGPLVRVDPRVKLLWVLATLVGGLVFADVVPLAVVLASIVVVAAAGGVLGETARRMRGLVTIILVIGLIFGFTVPGEPWSAAACSASTWPSPAMACCSGSSRR